MPSLPSFGELLHSIDQDVAGPSHARQPSYIQTPNFVFPKSPRSSPHPSSSIGQRPIQPIIVSSSSPPLPHISISHHSNQISSIRRTRSTRFQPYSSGDKTVPRRGSVSTSSDNSPQQSMDSFSLRRRRSVIIDRPLPSKLNIPASQPISGLLRRNSPKSSPSSPDFSSYRATPRTLTPVSLPTLPAFAFSSARSSYHSHSRSHSRTSSSGSVGSIASGCSGVSISTDAGSAYYAGRSSSPGAKRAAHRMQMWNGFASQDFPRE